MTKTGVLASKVAVVTGAGGGIGEAIARRYLDEGCKVIAVDVKAPAIEARDGLVSLTADVTDAAAPAKIRKLIEDNFVQLDILVNNAGVLVLGGIEDQSIDDWNRALAVNVTAAFRITQELLPLLKKSSAGRIINLGSIMSDFGAKGMLAYAMSKHAMVGFTKSLACDVGQYGITANYLQPGAIWSPMSQASLESSPDILAFWKGKSPLGTVGYPGDVVPAALMLATDEAKFITGAGIKICGGAMATV